MATMSTTSGYFILSATANGANTQTVTLSTQNKFVDKNVVVKFTTPAAAGATLAINDSTATVVVGEASGGYFPLNNGLTGSMSFSTAGWTSGFSDVTDSSVQVGKIAQSYLKVDSTTASSGVSVIPAVSTDQTITIAAGYEDARTIVIKGMTSGTAAVASVTASTAAVKPTLANSVESLGAEKTQITAAPTTASTDVGKYYFKVRLTAPETNFKATDFKKNVTTQGYLTSGTQITIENNKVKTTTSTNDYYIPITSGAASITVSTAGPTLTAGTSSATLSGKTKLSATPVTTASGVDTYYIPFSVNSAAKSVAAADITKEVTTNGYIDDVGQISAAASIASATTTYYMPITSGSLNAGAGSVTSNGTAGGVTILEEASSAPASGYYIAVTGKGTVSVGTAGWLASGTSKESNGATKFLKLKSASVTSNGASVTVSEGYVPSAGLATTIANGTISTGSTSMNGYVNNTSAVVPKNGYLYIGAGYYPNTQISLGTLIPDDTDKANAGNGNILLGYEAYDTNGNQLIGTIPTYDGTYSIT